MSDRPDVEEGHRYGCAGRRVMGGNVNLFELNRSADWRNHLDDDGKPITGPRRASHVGCHYCYGPLDATKATGVYECPWCIARFPTPKADEGGG